MTDLSTVQGFAERVYAEPYTCTRYSDGCACESCRWERAERKRRYRDRVRPIVTMDLAWQRSAACSESPPEWFFDEHGIYRYLARALEVCAGCAASAACLDHALAHREAGVWGGTTDDERAQLRRAKHEVA